MIFLFRKTNLDHVKKRHKLWKKMKPFFLGTEKPDLLRNILTVENKKRLKSKNFDFKLKKN